MGYYAIIWALLELFGASRGRLGGLWRAPGGRSGGLGYNWGLLGGLLGRLGGFLGRLGALLGRLGALLGRSWAVLGRSGELLGPLSTENHVFYGVFCSPNTEKCKKPRVFGV